MNQYGCIHAYIHTYIRIHAYISIDVVKSLYVCIYLCVCVYMYVCCTYPLLVPLEESLTRSHTLMSLSLEHVAKRLPQKSNEMSLTTSPCVGVRAVNSISLCLQSLDKGIWFVYDPCSIAQHPHLQRCIVCLLIYLLLLFPQVPV